MKTRRIAENSGNDKPRGIPDAPTRVLWETMEQIEEKGQGLEDAAAHEVLVDELDGRGVSLSTESLRRRSEDLFRATSKRILAGKRLRHAWDATCAEFGITKGTNCPADVQVMLANRHPQFLRTKVIDGSSKQTSSRKAVTGTRRRKAGQAADAAYEQVLQEVHNEMEHVKRAIEQHEVEQSTDRKNYGLVGDMEHVRQLLTEIKQFLGG